MGRTTTADPALIPDIKALTIKLYRCKLFCFIEGDDFDLEIRKEKVCQAL